MPVLLKDISIATGINICSVSQILNDKPAAQRLRPETRQLVLETARRLGYCRNEMAAAVANRKSRIIAFVSSDMGSSDYTGRVLNGVLDVSGEAGYPVITFRLSKMTPEKITGELLGWRIAGVLFHIQNQQEIKPIIEKLRAEKIPYGMINLTNPGGIGVTTDDADGIRQAVRECAQAGLAHPVYISSLLGDKSLQENNYQYIRIQAFNEAFSQYYPGGKPVTLALDSCHVGQRGDSIRHTLAEAISLKADAFICESDYMAIEIIDELKKLNKRIPEDYSVIGFGNFFAAQLTDPPLTTVAQDFEQLGQMTVKLLIDTIKGKKIPQTNICTPVKLIKRQSLVK